MVPGRLELQGTALFDGQQLGIISQEHYDSVNTDWISVIVLLNGRLINLSFRIGNLDMVVQFPVKADLRFGSSERKHGPLQSLPCSYLRHVRRPTSRLDVSNPFPPSRR